MIEVEDVSKTFTVRRRRPGRIRRERTAVRAVHEASFAVRRGEFVGYLGPNGAGKSTTIKMLTGILTPSSGRVRVCGLDPSRQRTALARRIGVVFGQRTTLWWDLPPRDSLTLIRHLYRVERDAHRVRLAELTELLVLDEPTIGLDVVSKATVREFLARINAERGTTILLTTHDLGDIERLCRRVLIIDRGRLAYDGGLERLRATVGADRLLAVVFDRPLPPVALPGTEVVRVEGPRQWLRLPRDANAAALVADLARRYEVRDIDLRETDIEDVLARLYRGEDAYQPDGQCSSWGTTPAPPAKER